MWFGEEARMRVEEEGEERGQQKLITYNQQHTTQKTNVLPSFATN